MCFCSNRIPLSLSPNICFCRREEYHIPTPFIRNRNPLYRGQLGHFFHKEEGVVPNDKSELHGISSRCTNKSWCFPQEETCSPQLTNLASIDLYMVSFFNLFAWSKVQGSNYWFLIVDTASQIIQIGCHHIHNCLQVKLKNMLYHTARINCLAWSPDNSMVATGSLDTCVIIYEVGKPASSRITIKGAHLGGVYGLAFTDENSIVSSGEDACVRVWKVIPQ